MVKELYRKLISEREGDNPIEVRQILSKLRQLIKEAGSQEELAVIVESDRGVLIGLLDSEDAKTRKNTALLMGELGVKEFLPCLYGAYERETQLFVRSSYLTAVAGYDYRELLPNLKEKLTELSLIELTEENRKHFSEETRLLTELIVGIEGVRQHPFTGLTEAADIILLTNRRHREVTAEQIEALGLGDREKPKLVAAGVRLQTVHLEDVMPVRTYQEILFLVRGMKTCEMDPLPAAHTIAESQLLKFLQNTHRGKAPFYFRVELKSKMPLSKKSVFLKRLTAGIEEYSGRKLINTTSRYEIEIRLIENQAGGCNLMVKLLTLQDDRFAYRKEYLSESIKPVNAALLTALARNYMIEDARVLDPFCGVGTMLIERQKQVPGNTAYGLDIRQEAVSKAALNTEAAGQIIHYINRDYFTFTHEYLFDEIFTNMPFAMGFKTERDIYDIYVGFFEKSGEHLTPSGRIILYSHNRAFIRKLSPAYGYKIVRETEVNSKEGTFLCVLERA